MTLTWMMFKPPSIPHLCVFNGPQGSSKLLLPGKDSNLEILIFGVQNIEISRFDRQRDLVTRTGEREIGAVFRRLPDNPGEWAYIKIMYSGHPGFHRFRANGSLQYSTYCNQYS